MIVNPNKEGDSLLFIYNNGHDDYGKRDMTLRKLLDFIKQDLLQSETKDDMINILVMLYNGDLDAEFIPNPLSMLDDGVEYTGIDPVYFSPRIEKLFNRQVFIVGDMFYQRLCGIEYNIQLDAHSVVTRHYLANSKRIVCNLPHPLTLEEQNLVLNDIP